MLFRKLKMILLLILRCSPSSIIIGPPKGFIKTRNWLIKNNLEGNYSVLYNEKKLIEGRPLSVDENIHKIFYEECVRISPEAFVSILPNGRVWGVDGTVITKDDFVLEDVSREFGKYKGRHRNELSVFNRIYLGKAKKYFGKIAVIATPGSYNYHHWLYDIMPRFHLLHKADILHQIDYFVFNYTGASFQKQSLEKLGIPVEKIIICNDRWKFYISAEYLIVPSLPDTLSQANDWTISFLRSVFLKKGSQTVLTKRIYIDRRRASTRKVTNQNELDDFLDRHEFERFFPEDYSIEYVANVFSEAKTVLGVHGSGLANLVFCSESVQVIDIVAPYHVDPVYYIITSRVGGTYSYLFGEGERPPEDADLVKTKRDDDIEVNINKLESLFNRSNKEISF